MKAVFTMGLPASGKSTLVNKKYGREEFTIIDPDEIKKEQADYDPKNPSVYHEWSKLMAMQRTADAIANEENVVIDGTGTNVEKMYKQMREFQSLGYVVELLYVKTSLQTALDRNAKRDRTVNPAIIYEKYETISTAFEILATIANKTSVIVTD